MANEWPIASLGELFNITSSKRIFAADYCESGVPFYRSKEIIEKAKGNAISTELFISREKFDGIRNKFGAPKANDILLTSVGTLGVPYLVCPDEEFYFKDGNLTWLQTSDSDVCPRFVYLWLRSNIAKRAIDEVTIGSTQQALTIVALKSLELRLPPLPEQKAIAHILGSLDDKIELNRRMNETLEGMAQALFKSWFVDFDPVIDNALEAGNPIPAAFAARAETRRKALADGTANRETAATFPAAFQETDEMGSIPEGWEVQSIAHVAEKIAMGPFGSRITRNNFVEHGVPVIRGGNLTSGFVDRNFVYLTEEKATELKSSNAFSGDIIFTHRGTIGQVGIIPRASIYPRYVVSQSQMFLRINSEIISAEFAFRYFKSGSGMERLLGYASQVGVPAIARPTTSLKSLPILVPDKTIVSTFDEINRSYVNKTNANKNQNENLSKLRDTLLPKLISGELRIEDAEKIVKGEG
ncbi:restriction endonuclease subunit S [Pontiellaceae bacterium B1224]|nr:restriction endonuclease subunit S [Pontiellaceae bacterium B1224]